jgi:hypothetical protein
MAGGLLLGVLLGLLIGMGTRNDHR